MEMYYTNNKLYINIEERINFSLINELKRKLYKIINSYQIQNIELNILNDERFEWALIDELINDYNSKYTGIFIVK